MKHVHYDEVKLEPVEAPGAEKVSVRRLIAQQDGAPTFHMRRFELQGGGRTPRHVHDWEHEVYILEGRGTVFSGGRGEPFRPGDVIYVPPGEEHFFAADAGEAVAFLCLVPKEGLGCGLPRR